MADLLTKFTILVVDFLIFLTIKPIMCNLKHNINLLDQA